MAKSVSNIQSVPTCYNLVNCETGTVDYVLNGTANGFSLSLNVDRVVSQISDGETTVTGCWTITSSTSCDSAVSTYSILGQVYDSCEECNYCGCPDTYDIILDEEGNPINCQQISSLTPTLNGSLQTVIAGSTDGAYGSQGTTFFTNITTSPYPIDAFYAGGGPSTVLDGYKDSLGNNIVKLTTITGPGTVWGTDSPTRLNHVGVWQGLPVCDEWIGFSFCVTLTETKTYCIGIGGDNRVRLKIDGVPIINAEIGTYTYYAWSVFEINLTAGEHVFELEGYNNSVAGACSGGNPAAFGAEIYDTDSTTLQGITTQVALDPYILFTTLDKIGDTFDIGETNGYSCPEGYAYSSCENMCVQIQTVPYNNCCYQLKDCITSEIFFLFSYDGTTNLGVPIPDDIGSRVISQITIDGETTDGCWSIVKSDTETCPVVEGVDPQPYTNITALTLTDSCISCRTVCIILHDCEGSQPDVIVNYPDLGLYIGQVLKIILSSSVIGWPDGTYCVTITASDDCTDSIASDIDLSTTLVYTTCLECNPICHLLTDCSDPENTLIVSGDISAYLGGVITIQGCKQICWKVSLSDTCEGSVPIPPVLSFYPGIGTGNLCTYTIPANSTVDLLSVDFTINDIVHNIVYVDPYQILNDINALGLGTYFFTSTTTLTVAGVNIYGELCFNYEAETPCYTPTCETYTEQCTYNTFSTEDATINVSITIDGVVYISPSINYNDVSTWLAWLNSLGLGLFGINVISTGPFVFAIYVFGDHNYSNIIITNRKTVDVTLEKTCETLVDYDSACEACLPIEPDPIPFVLNQRKVKPGYDTLGCSPEYTENILCNYSETLYDEMVKTRYGITICCDKDKDLDYWDIKKQLLDLKAIFSDTACQLQFPCYNYELVNLDPDNDSSFTYLNCLSVSVTIIVTNAEGAVTVCSSNLPVGTGGSPQVTKGILCPNPICP